MIKGFDTAVAGINSRLDSFQRAAARIARGVAGSQARAAQHDIARGALEAGPARRLAAQRNRSLSRGQQGVEDERGQRPVRGGQEGGPDKSASPAVARTFF